MRSLVIGSFLASMVLPALAPAATCTVTEASVLVKDAGFERPLPEMVGYALPVDVVESAGTFNVDFSGLPAGSFDISGVDNTLKIEPLAVSGTIDAAGNVALTPVLVHFTTALLPGVDLAAMEPFTTGLAAVSLSGKDYSTEGAPLDFTTGALRLEGQGIVTNAPVVGSATSGFSVTCTLAPIPSQAALPKAPKLVAHGTGKPGASVGGTLAGDALALKAKLTKGATSFDATQDVFVRIGLGGMDLVLLRVPAGTLGGSGKKRSVTDADGTLLHVLTGRKRDGNTLADVSGSLTLKESKKRFAVSVKESGVDLSALATAPSGTTATVTIGIGAYSVSDTVTVKPGAKKTVLK